MALHDHCAGKVGKRSGITSADCLDPHRTPFDSGHILGFLAPENLHMAIQDVIEP